MSVSELQLLQTAIMRAWNAVVITDANPGNGYAVVFANPAFCKMTGYTAEELHGRSLKMLQGPDTDPEVIERLRVCLREERYFEGSTTNYRKDGTPYVVRWNISPVHDENGVLTHFVSVQQDISDYIESERQSRLLARALDASHDPILITDLDERIVFANKVFSEVTGYHPDELIGNTPAILHSGQHEESFYADLRRALANGQPYRATFINRRRDGSIFYAEQSIAPIHDKHGKVTNYVSIGKDISERVLREQALREAASIDKLTAVSNRLHGELVLKKAHSEALESDRPLSIIMADIDFFKKINDQFGHPAGDRALRQVAQTMRNTVRNRDTVIRWGGEEFLIVLEACPLEPAIKLAERIRTAIEQQTDSEIGRITLSFGVAALHSGEAIESIIARADRALYDAKRNGRNQVCVSRPG